MRMLRWIGNALAVLCALALIPLYVYVVGNGAQIAACGVFSWLEKSDPPKRPEYLKYYVAPGPRKCLRQIYPETMRWIEERF